MTPNVRNDIVIDEITQKFQKDVIYTLEEHHVFMFILRLIILILLFFLIILQKSTGQII